jgi:3-methyladenine DNA glycosylase/8-oxoguanine DNA glycosylase
VAGRLEECAELVPEQAMRRLTAVPGIGPWTAAEVAQRSLGAADAVSVGDYHVPSLVGWALTGAPLDDAGMLALLEEYRPHRHRVVRLVELSGARSPRFGPRATVRDHRRI